MEFRLIFVATKNKNLDTPLILIGDVGKSHSCIIVPNLTFRTVLSFFCVCVFVLISGNSVYILCLCYSMISTVFDETYVAFLNKTIITLSAVILWVTC